MAGATTQHTWDRRLWAAAWRTRSAAFALLICGLVLAAPSSAQRENDPPACPPDATYVAPEDVGVEGVPICLPEGSGLPASHVDPVYSEVAREVLRLAASRDQRLEIGERTVVCWSRDDFKQIVELSKASNLGVTSSAAGWVARSDRVINLTHGTCEALGDIAYRGKAPRQQFAATPVWTLAHEAIHLGGIRDEGVADCYARQLSHLTATLLGADSQAARRIVELSAARADHFRSGSDYDDPRCYRGGALDLQVDDASLVVAKAVTSDGCPAGTARVELASRLPGGHECLPIGTDTIDKSRIDPLHSAVATDVITTLNERINGIQVREAIVVCWTAEDWRQIAADFAARGTELSAGARAFVSIPSNVIHLSPQVCPYLDAIGHHGLSHRTNGAAAAVSVLAHEAIHVARIADEPTAECYAAQLTEHTALLLGASPDLADGLHTMNRKRYANYLAGDPTYGTNNCATDATLDLGRLDSSSAPCPDGRARITPLDIGVTGTRNCLPVRATPSRESRVDPTYSRLATRLVGLVASRIEGAEPTTAIVVCWAGEDWNRLPKLFKDQGVATDSTLAPMLWHGWVQMPRQVINLHPRMCRHLDSIAYANEKPTETPTARAVAVLAHEAIHVAGIANEGIAECYALQLVEHAARQLGADPDHARRLPTLARHANAERQGTDYDSPDCYRGGPLDLDLVTPAQCAAGEQVVESLVPLSGETEPICLPVSVNGEAGSRVDPNYTRAASAAIAEAATLIGLVEQREPIAVCWSSDDWQRIAEWFKARGNDRIRTVFGFVSMPSNVVNLSPRTCATLDEIVYAGERPETMTASNAVAVIVHEALHTAGLGDEGETECYAVQLVPIAAIELDTDAAYGATLADLQHELNSTSRAGSAYDDPDCYDGGPLDLSLRTPEGPSPSPPTPITPHGSVRARVVGFETSTRW